MSTAQMEARRPLPDDSKERPRLDDLAASRIGKTLRARFDAIVNEPVPDRFVELLERLDSAEKKSAKADGHD